MHIEVYFDGLCQPVNPKGIACYAYVVKKDGQTIHSDSGLAAEPFSEGASNNVAEYTALIKALEWLLANGYSSAKVEVKSDSELVVNQMNGEYKVRTKQIVPLFQKAALLIKKFSGVTIQWVPREKNREADRLTEKAYNKVVLDDPGLLDRK